MTVTLNIKEGTCHCGCNGTPKGKKSKFIQGHDARLKSRLISAHRSGEKVLYNGTEKTAKQVARSYGFGAMITDAPAKPKAKPKQPKAKAKADSNGVAQVPAGEIAIGDFVGQRKSGPFVMVAETVAGPKAVFLKDKAGQTIARPNKATKVWKQEQVA